jgi:hypothetical protein
MVLYLRLGLDLLIDSAHHQAVGFFRNSFSRAGPPPVSTNQPIAGKFAEN